MAQLIQTGDMTPEWAHRALVAVMASSAFAKTVLAMANGRIRYGLTVGVGLATMVAGSGVGVMWVV